MLNYVWITLILLGISTALFIDISDISKNTYKNNQPLTASIKFSTNDPKKNQICDLIFDKKDFNDFFNTSESGNVKLSGKSFNDSINNSVKIILNVSERTPQNLIMLARSSGNSDDLIITAKNIHQTDSITYSAAIYFEEISFVMMKKITNETISAAKTAVEIAIGLIGIMALWLGVMKIAEEAGLIKVIANLLRPVTKKLFPEIPADHPAVGSMVMNISANMLGLGNAATPFGLKAMEELDSLNPNKGTATNSMITFLAINTAGLTLIPATAIAVRAASGSSDPAIIIATSLFGSACATLTGVTAAKFAEKIKTGGNSLFNSIKKNVRLFIGVLLFISVLILVSITGILNNLHLTEFSSVGFFKKYLQILSMLAIPFLILSIVGYGAIRKIKVYESFVEGAKEGFNVAVRIIPYLVAMLAAITIFRAGGAMDKLLIPLLSYITSPLGFPAEALPMALMRPLSGSGSLGIMTEILKVHGPDSFIGILVSTFYGSTETTFYVLAVYFGAVNIKNTRHALAIGLLADVAGILGALFIVKLLFG